MLPAGALLAAASGSRVMRRSEITGPPFCESPVWSSPDTCRPSSSAAMPSIWFTVTTPVPPMPIMRTPKSSSPTSRRGSGSSASRAGVTCFAFSPGTTVRKEGQSPSRQEKSLLQEAWWIWVLRPNSVSTGMHRQAVRLLAAVAAALADALVDEDALLGLGRLAALALAAQLGGALLVVDQDRHALHAGELLLRGEQLARGRAPRRSAASSTPR